METEKDKLRAEIIKRTLGVGEPEKEEEEKVEVQESGSGKSLMDLLKESLEKRVELEYNEAVEELRRKVMKEEMVKDVENLMEGLR